MDAVEATQYGGVVVGVGVVVGFTVPELPLANQSLEIAVHGTEFVVGPSECGSVELAAFLRE